MRITLPARFCSDITVTKVLQEGGQQSGYKIRKANTGETFEFGEEEFLLFQLIGKSSEIKQVQSGFKDKFGTSISAEAIEQFFEQLHELGLLDPEALKLSPGRNGGSKAPKQLDEDEIDDDDDDFWTFRHIFQNVVHLSVNE